MKTINIRYCGASWGPDPSSYPLMDELKSLFSVVTDGPADYLVVKETPDSIADFLDHRRDDQIRICCMGEALVPDFNLFDYALGVDRMQFGDRYMRRHTLIAKRKTATLGDLLAGKDVSRFIGMHSKFCNFIYSNPRAHPNRDAFFHLLSQYRKVDSLGSHLSNMESNILRESYRSDWRQTKIAAQGEYKFSIAFENATHRGYTSEKLLTAMLAGSMPIYWGDPDVAEEFNSQAFINCHEYASFAEVVSRIRELDTNDELYREILARPWLTAEQVELYRRSKEDLRGFLRNIFEQEPAEARRRGDGFWNSLYEQQYAQRFRAGATAESRAPSTVRRGLSKARRLARSMQRR